MTPFFSVIIPVYNRARLIAAALDSVSSQREDDLESIVVDDGSTDDTATTLASRPGITLLHQVSAGPGAARNLGLSVATGEYVAFLDSDDLWFPWTLASYRNVIELTGRPAVVVGRPAIFRDPAELAAVREGPLAFERFDSQFEAGTAWRWWGASSFVIRADVLRAVGGFQTVGMNGEDIDLMLRLSDAPGFVQITHPITFAYRQHPGGVMGNVSLSDLGMNHLIDCEDSGRYPGGTAMLARRRATVGFHVRPVSLELLRRGEQRRAWSLYRRTLGWHLRMGRVRYLLGFPAAALRYAFMPRHRS